MELSIIDIQGLTVHSQRITKNGNAQTVAVKNVKNITGVAGIYFLN